MSIAEFESNSGERGKLTTEEAYSWAKSLLRGEAFFPEYLRTLSDVRQIERMVADNEELRGIDLSGFNTVLEQLKDEQLRGLDELNHTLAASESLRVTTKDGDTSALRSFELQQDGTCAPLTDLGIVQPKDIVDVTILGEADE